MKLIVLRKKETKLQMRSTAFKLIAIYFSLSIFTSISMVFLTAFNVATLPQGVLYMLIGKTVPDVLGMMYIVAKYLFPNTP